ncbi:uncharacterized protein Fot_20256 [Forsythia ovata]|uniref:F-box domain-containing protein n=1 Tax=Forsythia ovata TaxID=205694 RepID=A0ABD1VR97_9LAMI
MNTKSVAVKGAGLLRLVEERIQRELEQERKKQQESLFIVPYLPKDCISKILVQLPLESLQKSRFVCKAWYGIVNTPVFIGSHLQRSDTGLIFLAPVTKGHRHPSSSDVKTVDPPIKPNTFSVESKVLHTQSVPICHWPHIHPSSLFYVMFMEIKNGKSTIKEYNETCIGKIRATCNGLILLENRMKKEGLVVMNPVTRELMTIPMGTQSSPHCESYGLVFCHRSSNYKVVHLFQDESQYIGCEIINIGSGCWRVTDGPSFGLFGWLGYEPVFAMGALHWLPLINHNDYIVSLLVDDEKFKKIPLPKSGEIHDRIVAMSGFLGFVTHEDMNRIDVWILRDLGCEVWQKLYTIRMDCTKNMVPLYCSRIDGEIIFKKNDYDLYSYVCSSQIMSKVEVKKGCFPFNGCYLPHVNSLVSWRIPVKR